MAISKEIFRSIIREGQELLQSVELYNRPYEFEEYGRYVFVGVRQAGKSYMLYKRAKMLLEEGHKIEEFVYVDFDDERLLEMTANDFDVILQTYQSIYPHKPILLFDEIQNIDGWEHFARRMANQKYQIFISGSNAKMLSRDIHTTLGSRYMDVEVFPYSFVEFLGAQGIELSGEWAYGAARFKVMQLFSQYLEWGGFMLADVNTLEREIGGLEKLDKIENFRRMVIVTLEDEQTIELPNGKTIEVLPAWKWLLE